MKNRIAYTCVLVLVLALALSSCDKLPRPLMTAEESPTPPGSDVVSPIQPGTEVAVEPVVTQPPTNVPLIDTPAVATSTQIVVVVNTPEAPAAPAQPTATQAAAVNTPAPPTATTAPAQATTPTGVKFDPYATFGSPKVVDPFNINSESNWEGADGNLPNNNYLKMSIDNNQFYVIGKQLGFSSWWFSWASLKDFFIEFTANSGTCTGKDSYGMILRGPAHQAGKSFGYIVSFSCDGAYQVTRLDRVDPYQAVTLVDWTKNSAIQTGSNQTNIMGVRASGSTLTIYANGYKVGDISDSTYSEGRIGLFINPAQTQNYTYRAVKLAYWVLNR